MIKAPPPGHVSPSSSRLPPRLLWCRKLQQRYNLLDSAGFQNLRIQSSDSSVDFIRVVVYWRGSPLGGGGH